MSSNVELNDNELLYLYNESKNYFAYNLLEKKYLNNLKISGYKYLRNTSISKYYTQDDVDSLITIYFKEGCDIYKYNNNNKKFKCFIFLFVRNRFLDNCRSFSNYKHNIMNICRSYDDDRFDYLNNCVDSLEKTPDSLSNYENENVFKYEWICNYLDNNFKDEKEIFLEWASDKFSIKDICKKYNKNIKYLRSRLYYIRQRMKDQAKIYFN